MRTKHEIDAFFNRINTFLTTNHLESITQKEGYSQEEIEAYEQLLGFEFPYAYQQFLSFYAKKSMRFFGGQSYQLERIQDAFEVAEELLNDAGDTIPTNTFPFSQWQGYNFYYMEKDKVEPKVSCYMEGKGIFEEWSFCDWVKWQIECDLKSRLFSKEIHNQNLLLELSIIQAS